MISTGLSRDYGFNNFKNKTLNIPKKCIFFDLILLNLKNKRIIYIIFSAESMYRLRGLNIFEDYLFHFLV